MRYVKGFFLILLAVFFTAAGVNHFIMTDFYRGVMPDYMPFPDALIAISGVTEVMAGVGLLFRRTRAWAAWGIIAMLLAFMPVHIHMVMAPERYPDIPLWLLWARFPLQALFILWAYWFTGPAVPHTPKAA